MLMSDSLSGGLNLIERSALRRTALGNGQLVPVARLYAHALADLGLVHVLLPSKADRALVKLARVEVWCWITNRGRSLIAEIDGQRASRAA